jgi:glucan 1,3-beta-glucosidase
MAPFWMESMPHRGRAPFHADAENYKVFRNVKDFGAQGDGVTDDTEAIKLGMPSTNVVVRLYVFSLYY